METGRELPRQVDGLRCHAQASRPCVVQAVGAAMTVRTARCACGACHIKVEGELISSGLCSCDNCKRRTGAPFGWSVYFRDEQVRRDEGPLTVLEGMGKRWFCATCGSTLYWKSFGAWRPGQTGFAGGCFADPTLPSPNYRGALCTGDAVDRLPRWLHYV